MTVHYLLRVDHQAEPISLMQYNEQTKQCQVESVDTWQDDRLQSKNIQILVPATWVFHGKTHIASKNHELLTKSIPFAIEEELSNEVEDNFCAFRLNEDGSQDVIAIDQQHLQSLHAKISDHGLTVAEIYSEVDWLPDAEAAVVIWFDENSALLKIDAAQAIRVANHQVDQMLPIFAANKSLLRCNPNSVLTYAALPVEASLDAAECCQTLYANQAINLYVDEVKAKQQAVDRASWRKVIGLVVALSLSWVVLQGYQWHRLNQSIEDTKTAQRELFQQAYPNAAATELLDPYAALQSRLKMRDSQTSQKADVFLAVVDHLGQVMSKQSLVKLNGLRFIDGKAEIQIVAPNMTVINEFHQSLQQQALRFAVQIGVNELNDDNTFKSIITMVSQ